MAIVGARLHTWGIPGFRSGTLWKGIVAGLGYAVILILTLLTLFSPLATPFFLVSSLLVVALATNYRGVRNRMGRNSLWLGPVAFIIGAGAFIAAIPTSPEAREQQAAAKLTAAANQTATQEARTLATSAAAAGREALSQQARAEAVDLLGQAVSQREGGNLGLAIELGRQAQGKWSDYPDARSFLAEVQPLATAAAAEARAQATAAVQAAQAQATAAAQAQATANAQATAQAATVATAAASQPIVIQGRGQTATQPITPRSAQSVLTFTHNGARNFVVQVFRGNARDLLVNKIGVYQGQRPVMGAEPFTLNIEADGAWTVSITPVGGNGAPAFSGRGDAVSAQFTPPGTGPWEFKNTGARNFVVYLHCRNGRQLVQNRIGAFEGSAVTQFGTAPCYWEVESDGQWSLAPR